MSDREGALEIINGFVNRLYIFVIDYREHFQSN